MTQKRKNLTSSPGALLESPGSMSSDMTDSPAGDDAGTINTTTHSIDRVTHPIMEEDEYDGRFDIEMGIILNEAATSYTRILLPPTRYMGDAASNARELKRCAIAHSLVGQGKPCRERTDEAGSEDGVVIKDSKADADRDEDRQDVACVEDDEGEEDGKQQAE